MRLKKKAIFLEYGDIFLILSLPSLAYLGLFIQKGNHRGRIGRHGSAFTRYWIFFFMLKLVAVGRNVFFC